MKMSSSRPPICLAKMRKRSQTIHQSKQLSSSRDIIKLKGSRACESSRQIPLEQKSRQQSKPLVNITNNYENQSIYYPQSCRHIERSSIENINFLFESKKQSLDIQNQQNQIPFVQESPLVQLMQSECLSMQNVKSERISNLLAMIVELTQRLHEQQEKVKQYKTKSQQIKDSQASLLLMNKQLKENEILKDQNAKQLNERVQKIQEQLDELRQLYQQYKLTELKYQRIKQNATYDKIDIQVQTQAQREQQKHYQLLVQIKQPIIQSKNSTIIVKSQTESQPIQIQLSKLQNTQQNNFNNLRQQDFWKYKAHNLKNQLEIYKLKYINLERKFKVEEENRQIQNKRFQQKHNKKLEALKQHINDKNEEIKQKQNILRRFLSGQCRVRLSN